MNLTPEERKTGQENYYSALSVSRRDFLIGALAAGAATGSGLGAMYFGYQKPSNPVRVGVIGTGDEGGVLIGAMNPDYVQVTAIADIRPSSVHRAFHGDWSSAAAIAARKGLMNVYGWASEDEARRHVKVYTDYHDLLKDENVEAVVIALPLHLHAPAAIEAMTAHERGWRKDKLHVLCEKLMAKNVALCKLMGREAERVGVHLATGHQRHYSVLYDNAVNLIRWGVLGELHHIRAQWHRGNLPGNDSWQMPVPGGKRSGEKLVDLIGQQLAEFQEAAKTTTDPAARELLMKKIRQWSAWDADKAVRAELHGYESGVLGKDYKYSELEELVRWRLFERTGGGLMAELGSHQLDAASIFCSALRRDGKKAHPLTVHAVGGRHIFPQDRHSDDHVYCMYEFPAPGYEPGFDVGYKDPVLGYPGKDGVPGYDTDKNKKIVVTYSSINGNGFGGYGEVVMGTKGTLVLHREQEVMLYKDADTTTTVSVKQGPGGPRLDTQESGAGGAVAKAAASTGPVSRGYTEEIEHWAWCIRNPDPANRPRCHPEVALGDAVIALTTTIATKNGNMGKSGYIAFEDSWYDIHHDATPDGSTIEGAREELGLVKSGGNA